MRASEPSEDEIPALLAAGISDPVVQRYTVYRRSLLILVAPLAVLSAILSAIDAKDIETETLNALGVLAELTPTLAIWVMMGASLLALSNWAMLHKSGRILMIGWGISVVAPLLIALAPVDWLVDSAAKAQAGPNFQAVRLIVGLGYAINLLPTVLTFPSGVIRGATRIKSLIPTSTVAGWSLLMLIPMYGLIFIIAMVLIGQVAGNPLLVLGTLCMAASPFIHMTGGRLYVRPLTEEEPIAELAAVQRKATLLSLAGITLITLWALTAKFGEARVVGTGDGALLTPLTIVVRGVEFGARLLITTAVFSHLLLQMTEASWRHERAFHLSPASKDYETQMASVERSLRASGDQTA